MKLRLGSGIPERENINERENTLKMIVNVEYYTKNIRVNKGLL